MKGTYNFPAVKYILLLSIILILPSTMFCQISEAISIMGSIYQVELQNDTFGSETVGYSAIKMRNVPVQFPDSEFGIMSPVIKKKTGVCNLIRSYGQILMLVDESIKHERSKVRIVFIPKEWVGDVTTKSSF